MKESAKGGGGGGGSVMVWAGEGGVCRRSWASNTAT